MTPDWLPPSDRALFAALERRSNLDVGELLRLAERFRDSTSCPSFGAYLVEEAGLDPETVRDAMRGGETRCEEPADPSFLEPFDRALFAVLVARSVYDPTALLAHAEAFRASGGGPAFADYLVEAAGLEPGVCRAAVEDARRRAAVCQGCGAVFMEGERWPDEERPCPRCGRPLVPARRLEAPECEEPSEPAFLEPFDRALFAVLVARSVYDPTALLAHAEAFRASGDGPAFADYLVEAAGLEPGTCQAAVEDARRRAAVCQGCGAVFMEGERWSDEGRIRLGNYEIIELLGQGGLGKVYRARDVDLDREVALKVIAAGDWAGDETRERFRREARAAASIEDPNVVAVYDAGSSEGQVYLAMELLDGPALSHHVEAERLPVRRALQYVAQAARGIAAAHACGVLHRDVKPANLMLDRGGRVRVTDFGLARSVEAGGESLTVSGSVLGTLGYMPPEQANAGSASVRSDVYGLGATLYALLAGRPPFAGDDAVEVLAAILDREPPALGRLARGLPRDVEAIVERAMAKEPEWRYATALELAEDIERYLGGYAVHARPLGRSGRALRWVRRRKRPLAAASFAAIAAIAAAAGASALDARRTARIEAAERRAGAMVEERAAEAARRLESGSPSGFEMERLREELGLVLAEAGLEEGEIAGRVDHVLGGWDPSSIAAGDAWLMGVEAAAAGRPEKGRSEWARSYDLDPRSTWGERSRLAAAGSWLEAGQPVRARAIYEAVAREAWERPAARVDAAWGIAESARLELDLPAAASWYAEAAAGPSAPERRELAASRAAFARRFARVAGSWIASDAALVPAASGGPAVLLFHRPAGGEAPAWQAHLPAPGAGFAPGGPWQGEPPERAGESVALPGGETLAAGAGGLDLVRPDGDRERWGGDWDETPRLAARDLDADGDPELLLFFPRAGRVELLSAGEPGEVPPRIRASVERRPSLAVPFGLADLGALDRALFRLEVATEVEALAARADVLIEAGRFEEALEFVTSKPESFELFLRRAYLEMRLGRFAEYDRTAEWLRSRNDASVADRRLVERMARWADAWSGARQEERLDGGAQVELDYSGGSFEIDVELLPGARLTLQGAGESEPCIVMGDGFAVRTPGFYVERTFAPKGPSRYFLRYLAGPDSLEVRVDDPAIDLYRPVIPTIPPGRYRLALSGGGAGKLVLLDPAKDEVAGR